MKSKKYLLNIYGYLALVDKGIYLLKECLDSIKNFMWFSISLHICWSSYNFVLPIYARLINIGHFHLCTKGWCCLNWPSIREILCSISQCHLYSLRSKDFGSNDWSNTSQSNDFTVAMEIFKYICNILLNSHIFTLEAKVTEILGCSKTSRY